MIKYSFILVCFYGIIIVGAQKTGVEQCDNVCYRGLKDDLERLIDLYKHPQSVTNIPSLDEINKLINKTENVISNIKDLDDVKNKSQATHDTILDATNKLKLFKNIVDEINLIISELNDLRRKKNIKENAFDKCNEADKLYATLRDDVENIKKIGKDIAIPLDVPKRIDEIKKESWKIKNSLDQLRISDSLFQSYVCNSRLQTTIQDIINNMIEIANMLQAFFEGEIKSKLKEIENDITENQQNIEEMRKSLDEQIPTTGVKTNDKTKPTIEDLKNKIKDLKNKIKNIKIDKTHEDILENASKLLKDLLNEYEIILNHMFSKENIEKVKEEIKKARRTLRLLEEKHAVKAELDTVKQIVETLKDREVCFINEPVSVEDKILDLEP